MRPLPCLLAVVTLLGAACRRPPPPEPPPVIAAAVVNGQPIPVPTLQRELDRLRRGAGGEAAPVEAKEVPELARALLGPLIDRTLLNQRAREAGVVVSDVDVQREIDRLAESSAQGGQAFDERLRLDGLTADGLAAEIRERLLGEKFVASKVPPQPTVTKDDARAYYEAHLADYQQPDAVHAWQIVVSSAEEAKSLLDQLRNGATFEELAKKKSESPDGKNGGDLGFFSRGTMPKVFDDACFSLRVGALSGVVASPYGYHLFRITEKRSAHRRPFEEVRAEIERRLTAERRAAAERKFLDDLRAQAKVQVNEAQLSTLR